MRALVVGLAFIAAVMTLSAERVLARELRIAELPGVPFSAIVLARQKGWVEEELQRAGAKDVTVKWLRLSGGPAANEAFAAGNIDIAAMGDTPALIGRANGLDTKLVGFACSGAKAEALLVRANSPFKTIRDLKGRKVATLRGGNVHYLLNRMLSEAGMAPSDIQFVNMTLPDMGIALESGDVDAIVAWEPLYTKLVMAGSARVLRDGEGLFSNLNPVIVSTSLLREAPDLVKAVLRAFRRAADELTRDPEGTSAALAKEFGLTPEQALTASRRFTWINAVSEAQQKEFADELSFLIENRLVRKGFEMKDFFDGSFAP